MSKKTAVVICPGRGTYNKTELGYLHNYHQNKKNFIDSIDEYRAHLDQPSIWEIDGMKEFSPKVHLPGENSASLIYACSYADFLSINREKYEIEAITGNSMGWYLACVCAGALSINNGTHLINTMGSQMKEEIIGGQIIYPEVDDNWIYSPELSALIDSKMDEVNKIDGHEVYNSINFGGLRIIGGNDSGLIALLKCLPSRENRYPFRLMGNAAFHTPLLTETSIKARQNLKQDLFNTPEIPLIDGRGKIWMPYATNLNELWDYTLGHQVDNTYDFTKAIEVAVKEFAPDHLIITGPGMTMGGAVAQTLINKKLKPIKDKEEFKRLQMDDPYLISMSENSQRELVL
ncbi:MAG: ACP S-malonyltransferase [Bacteriovoracaceae bacterium]